MTPALVRIESMRRELMPMLPFDGVIITLDQHQYLQFIPHGDTRSQVTLEFIYYLIEEGWLKYDHFTQEDGIKYHYWKVLERLYPATSTLEDWWKALIE